LTYHNFFWKFCDVFGKGAVLLGSLVLFSNLVCALENHWHSLENQKRLFEKFAQDNGFDPLNPNNWYAVPFEKLLNYKGMASILLYHRKSVRQALQSVFPNILLDPSKFTRCERNHWQVPENRRHLFESFAKTNGFDSLVPENWYAVPTKKFIKFKGAPSMMHHFNNVLSRALMDAFPEVPFDETQFSSIRKEYWAEEANRRWFFENLAKDQGMDPLLPKTWHSIPSHTIHKYKGASQVMQHYNGSILLALASLFPEVVIDGSKINPGNFKYWTIAKNRRDLFEGIARQNGLDIYDPEKWPSLPTSSFMRSKGVKNALFFHNGSVAQALSDLFPEAHMHQIRPG